MIEENSNQVPPTNDESASPAEQSGAGEGEVLNAVPVQQPYDPYYGYGQPYPVHYGAGQPYDPYYGYAQGAVQQPAQPSQPAQPTQPAVEARAEVVKDEPKPKKHTMWNTFLAGFAGAAVAFIACVGGFALWSAFADDADSDDTAAIESTDAADDDSDDATVTLGATETTEIDAEDEDVSLAEAVAAKCLPSVCSIVTYVYESSYYSSYSYGFGSSSTDDDELVEYALGSGVILTEDGYILTNYHVISGSDYIEVTIEGVTYEAEVVGYDSSSDIAVLMAVDASGLTPIEIGDSDDLNVGEWVMTIGNPFGLEQSVATGVVSAVSRSMILESEDDDGTYSIYTNMIQTDAAINPGNSGGALVNSDGQLIGINTLIESYSGNYSGVGFAIPVNYAISIAEQIIAGETPTHAQLGVSLMSVTSTIADRYGLSVDEGAYVVSVTEGSAADEAGIQEGDIIISLNGEEVESATDLTLLVRSNNPGDTVTIELIRDGETITLEVTLGSDEEEETEDEDDSSSEEEATDEDEDDSSSGSGSMLDNLNSNDSSNSSGPNSGMGNGFGGMSYDAEDTEVSTEEETVYTS